MKLIDIKSKRWFYKARKVPEKIFHPVLTNHRHSAGCSSKVEPRAFPHDCFLPCSFNELRGFRK